MTRTAATCRGARNPGEARRSVSRLAVRSDAAADDGRDGRAALSSMDRALARLRQPGGGERRRRDGGLGGARLLCPRAQSGRLRQGRGRRAWRAFPDDRGRAARAAGHRRLYRRRDRRDRVRRAARWWSTPMSSASSRGCSRRQPLPSAAVRSARGRRDHARRPRRRFRAGDDGPGLGDLHAARPRCLLCPLRDDCAAFAAGEPEAFPVKAAKAAKPQRYGTIFWAAGAATTCCSSAARPRGCSAGCARCRPGRGTERRPGSHDAPVAADWRCSTRPSRTASPISP